MVLRIEQFLEFGGVLEVGTVVSWQADLSALFL